MKKNITSAAQKLRLFLLAVVCAAIALMALPLGVFGLGRRAAAEVQTGGYDGEAQPDVATSAAGTYELTFNYYRGNGNYDGWNLWAWAPGVDGSQYNFTETTIADKKWVTVTVTMTNVTPSSQGVMGVIVRHSVPGNDWDNKAVQNDIWVPESVFGDDNKATIYMADSVADIYTNAEDAMNHKVILKINYAYFQSATKILVNVNKGVTAKSIFKVKDGAGTVLATLRPKADGADHVDGKDFNIGALTFTIDLGDNFVVDYTGKYTVYDEPAGTFDPELNYPEAEVNVFSLYDNDAFGEKYNYSGTLGAQYSQAQTVFTVWSPVAKSVSVAIYDAGEGGNATERPMTRGDNGEWSATVTGDLAGKYYTYRVTDGANLVKEIVDPYARSGGKNGLRGMIVDFDSASAKPEGWDSETAHKIPDYKSTKQNLAQAVIWEAHLRDLTINPNSGVSAEHRGKYLGLTETGTVNSKGQATALDYIKSLGVTQVHFQPLFDFASVDEGFTQATYQENYDSTNKGQFNWGYDPLNYNMPEGSYSTNPSDGYSRVKEMRQMVMALHNAGIQVVMDVVYNHVSSANDSNFEALMPGYYFRRDNTGKLYNGSGCGNETASDRYMFRKFMIESVKYWTEYFKIDGFRFDLMGLHDTDTMNKIYNELVEINPDVIIYGEGWTGGTSGLSSIKQAIMSNARNCPNIAFFDDIVRDGLKGGVFDSAEPGFAMGKMGTDAAVYVAAAGATNELTSRYYDMLDKTAFASSPTQNINYVSAHDNHTLWDKINASVTANLSTRKAMNRIAATASITGQGAAFMLAGEEMLRSKPTQKDNPYDNRPCVYKTDPNYYFSDNSYKSPDSVNAINWELIDSNSDMVDYYKALIKIKRTFPQFQLTDNSQIRNGLYIHDGKLGNSIASYAIKAPDSDTYAVVLYNVNGKAKKVSVPEGKYSVYVNGAKANADAPLSTFSGGTFTVGAYSAVIMTAELDKAAVTAWTKTVDEPTDAEDGNIGLALGLGLGIGIPAVAVIAGGVVFGVKKSKKKKSVGGDDNNGNDGKDGGEGNKEPDGEGNNEPEPEAQSEPEQPTEE